MSKYKLPGHLAKKKLLNKSYRKKVYESVEKLLRDLILDPEFPLVEVEGCVEQGITKSFDTFPATDSSISPNGTFTLTLKINGGAQNIEENESIILVKPKGLFNGHKKC
jgi:hypothetical protein